MTKAKKGVTFNHNPLLRSELPAWRRWAHREFLASEFFDTGVSRPGALLELQLAPLDFELTGALLLAFDGGIQLAGLVLGRDDAKAARHHQHHEKSGQAGHLSPSSARRSA